MKMIGKCLATVAACGLVAAPVVASAAEVEGVREAAPVDQAEGIGGGLLLAGFVVALGAIIIIASDDDEPASP